MSTFPLNRMPYSLKKLILEHFDPDDSLKLLQTNQELRLYLLSHGPFPKNIKELHIAAVICKVTATGMICKWLQLDVDSFSSFFCGVANRETPDNQILLKATDWPLFRRMRSCASVNVSVDFHGRSENKAPLVNHFLPNLYVLRDLTLSIPNSLDSSSIFRYLTMQIEGRFEFHIQEDDHGPLQKWAEIERFFRECLRDCQRIHLSNVPPHVLDFFVDVNQEKTHMFRELSISQRPYDDFVEVIKSILENGIPSQCAEAVVEIRLRPGQGYGGEALRETLDGLTDCCDVDEATGWSMILPKFLRFPRIDPYEYMNQNDNRRATYYRRKFSETIEYYYIFVEEPRYEILTFYAASA